MKEREMQNVITTSRGEPVEMVPLDEIRRRHVTKVLDACGGNRTDAARILRLDRKTLYRKLIRWGLTQR